MKFHFHVVCEIKTRVVWQVLVLKMRRLVYLLFFFSLPGTTAQGHMPRCVDGRQDKSKLQSFRE